MIKHYKKNRGVKMDRGKYNTAYSIGKLMEVVGWITMGLGVIISLIAFEQLGVLALLIFIVSIVSGLIIVFQAQIILIIIDTEFNTREIASEIKKTNLMLAESLGKIIAKLNS